MAVGGVERGERVRVSRWSLYAVYQVHRMQSQDARSRKACKHRSKQIDIRTFLRWALLIAFAFFRRSLSLAFFNSDSGTVFLVAAAAAGTFLSVGALVWREHETRTRFKLAVLVRFQLRTNAALRRRPPNPQRRSL